MSELSCRAVVLSGTQEGASDKAAVHGVVKQLCNAYILKGPRADQGYRWKHVQQQTKRGTD